MSPFIWTVLWNLVVALGLIVVIFLARFITKKLKVYLDYITALTVWLLLWIVFLWFFPELMEAQVSKESIWAFILLWIFVFYILELFLHWHHCKDLTVSHHEHVHEHESSKLIFAWTFLHNAFHWLEIFAAFAINFHFWLTVTLAILLHSIPQNVVNYVMNHNNLKIVIFWSLAWVFWSLLTYPLSNLLLEYKYFMLSIIAWWLLYTALADIFPSFKSKWSLKNKLVYLIFVVFWIFIYLFFATISWHEHEYETENEKTTHIETHID